MAKDEIKQVIDVDKIFLDKNPGLYKMLPGFLLSYIKRVIHQDEMNHILYKGEQTKGVDFANLVLNEMGVKITCSGLENIPTNGPIIIAANHPLGGLDAMALISYVGQIRNDIRYLVNDILTRLPNFGEIFVPVNKLGINAKSNLESIEQIYASDAAIMIFPAGLCSRKINGEITDLEWQKSFVSKAQKYQHPIIPIFVKAKNSNWFYNLSRFRIFLGIKANIEMFYLPDEMFKQKNKVIELVIGKPIKPEILSEKKSAKEWAKIIKSYVYQLEKNPSLAFSEYQPIKK